MSLRPTQPQLTHPCVHDTRFHLLIGPGTAEANPLGFLAIECTFSADASAPTNAVSLGRSWVEGTPGETIGQAVIRDSVIGEHIRKDAPWNRTSVPKAQFYEYCNRGPGAAR